jgi:hypothetical protein
MAKEERIFTSEETILCEKLVRFGLVVDQEARGIVTTTVKNNTYETLAAFCDSDEQLERLSRILPQNDDLNSRYRFMVEKRGMEVLEKFMEDDFWERYSEEDFLDIKNQLIFTAPGSLFANFIALCEEPSLTEWFGGKRGVLRFINESASSNVISLLLGSPQIDYIVSNIPFGDFMGLLAVFNAVDLISHPQICMRLAELRINPEDWAENLYELNMLLYDLDLVGFDTKAIKEVMLGEYKKSLAIRLAHSEEMTSEQKDQLHDEIGLIRQSGENYENRMRFESAVRAGIRDGGQLDKIKSRVGRKDRDAFSKKWEQRIRGLDIAWLESKDNPQRYLLPTLGYEIEFESDTHFDMSSYSLAERVGFKKGVGSSGSVLELSPGPFVHHRTAGLTFLSYIDSGMIDMDRYFDQSVHLNIGFESKTGVISFMRLLQLTGYAFNPVYNDEALSTSYTQDGAHHELRVRRNDQGTGAYVECKEFSLMTPSDFMRFLRCSQVLGAGLLAYQRIFAATNSAGVEDWRVSDIDNILGNDFFKNDNYWMTTIMQKMTLIERSSRSSLEKELATIYVNFLNDLRTGLVQVGMNNFLTNKVDMKTTGAVVEELRSVFPDLYSRMTANAIESVTENMIMVEGELYPNTISFVRNKVKRAVGEIEMALMVGEYNLAIDLGEARRKKDIKGIWSLIKEHEVLLGLNGLTPVEKKQRLINLSERYKSIGWV